MQKLFGVALAQLLGLHFSQAITVSFDHARFQTPAGETYIENYMLFDGSDIRFVPYEQGFRATAELTYVFKTDDGTIVDFSKTLVHSPTVDDSSMVADFIDLQRFNLAPGRYSLTIKLKDVNAPDDTITHRLSVTMPDDMVFSDVFLVERTEPSRQQTRYSRMGLEMYPRVSHFYPPRDSVLTFYAELYHTDKLLGKGAQYLLVIDILAIDNEQPIAPYHQFRRMNASPFETVFRSMNISELPTGTYTLRIEIRNRENKPVAHREVEFKRFANDELASELPAKTLMNTFAGKLSHDSLKMVVYCMRPVASLPEEIFIDENLNTDNDTVLRKFFYGFWYDRNPVDPRTEWHRYHQRIVEVNNKFSTARKQSGCATDRGRVYLKYGKPDGVTSIRNEPSAYPYEIWHYHALPKKQNAKFVFADFSHNNDYMLLNSNVPGEIVDRNWYMRLFYRPGGMSVTQDFQQEEGVRMDEYGVGSRALDYWNNPRYDR